MLGKLIKHEFKATYKAYGLLFAALILLTIVSKITLRVDSDFAFYNFATKLFQLVDIVLMFSVCFVGTCMVIARVYKHLLTDEGYLSHTLPVKTWQHIVTKCIVGTVWIVLSYIVMCLAIMIYIGNYSKIWHTVKEIFNDLGDHPKLIGIAIMVLIIVIAFITMTVNSYMMALSIGQLFKKYKIASSVIIWFAMYFAFGIIISMCQPLLSSAYDKIIDVKSMSRYGISYLILCIILACEILGSAICTFVTNYMLTKKLNLE